MDPGQHSPTDQSLEVVRPAADLVELASGDDAVLLREQRA